jgi:D-lactate dehydrogenase
MQISIPADVIDQGVIFMIGRLGVLPTAAIFDAGGDDEAYFREQLGGTFRLVISEDGLIDAAARPAADALVVSVSAGSRVTAGIMGGRLPQARFIACRSTGYDNVDLAYARAHHIAVSNVPVYGDATVAEYAMLLMLAVSRKLRQAMGAVDAGKVVTAELTGRDLQGRTHLAGIARGFGLTVIAADPRPDEAAARAAGFRYVDSAELLATSDIISLHAPAVPQTHHLLDRAAFGTMRRGVVVINTSRGSLIDTPALVEAIEAGVVAGAGLDVLEGEEFLESSNERQLLSSNVVDDRSRQVLALDLLLGMPNVVITDHNAFNTVEALQRIREGTAANIHAWHAGHPVHLV